VKNAIVFPILPGSAEAQVISGGVVKLLLIGYLIRGIIVKKYQNSFTCVKVISSQRWDVFEIRCTLYKVRSGSVHRT